MRGIITTNEFVYDVLNNLIHRKAIIIEKRDINKPLEKILTRQKDNLILIDLGSSISIQKKPEFKFNVFLRQTP